MPIETNFAEERALAEKRLAKLGRPASDVDTVIGKQGVSFHNITTVSDALLKRALGLPPVALLPSGGAEAVYAANPVEKLAAHFREKATQRDRAAEIVAEVNLREATLAEQGKELSAVDKLNRARAAAPPVAYVNPTVRRGHLRPDLESDAKRLMRMSAKHRVISGANPIMAGQMEPEINRLRARLKSAGVDLSAIGG